jgi:hypothetical protein
MQREAAVAAAAGKKPHSTAFAAAAAVSTLYREETVFNLDQEKKKGEESLI